MDWSGAMVGGGLRTDACRKRESARKISARFCHRFRLCGGITYSQRHGNGPAAAQYRARPPPAMRQRPLRDGVPGTIYPSIRDGAYPRPRKAVERPRKPKTLIHGRAIGATHARRARRWVSHQARCLRELLSAVLTAPAQTLCRSGPAKIPRNPLPLQTTRNWRSIGAVQFPTG